MNGAVPANRRLGFLGCARNDILAVLSGTLGHRVTSWGLGITMAV